MKCAMPLKTKKDVVELCHFADQRMASAVHRASLILDVACCNFQVFDGGPALENGQDRGIARRADKVPNLGG